MSESDRIDRRNRMSRALFARSPSAAARNLSPSFSSPIAQSADIQAVSPSTSTSLTSNTPFATTPPTSATHKFAALRHRESSDTSSDSDSDSEAWKEERRRHMERITMIATSSGWDEDLQELAVSEAAASVATAAEGLDCKVRGSTSQRTSVLGTPVVLDPQPAAAAQPPETDPVYVQPEAVSLAKSPSVRPRYSRHSMANIYQTSPAKNSDEGITSGTESTDAVRQRARERIRGKSIDFRNVNLALYTPPDTNSTGNDNVTSTANNRLREIVMETIEARKAASTVRTSDAAALEYVPLKGSDSEEEHPYVDPRTMGKVVGRTMSSPSIRMVRKRSSIPLHVAYTEKLSTAALIRSKEEVRTSALVNSDDGDAEFIPLKPEHDYEEQKYPPSITPRRASEAAINMLRSKKASSFHPGSDKTLSPIVTDKDLEIESLKQSELPTSMNLPIQRTPSQNSVRAVRKRQSAPYGINLASPSSSRGTTPAADTNQLSLKMIASSYDDKLKEIILQSRSDSTEKDAVDNDTCTPTLQSSPTPTSVERSKGSPLTGATKAHPDSPNSISPNQIHPTLSLPRPPKRVSNRFSHIAANFEAADLSPASPLPSVQHVSTLRQRRSTVSNPATFRTIEKKGSVSTAPVTATATVLATSLRVSSFSIANSVDDGRDDAYRPPSPKAPPMRRRSNWSASAALSAVSSGVSYLTTAASTLTAGNEPTSATTNEVKGAPSTKRDGSTIAAALAYFNSMGATGNHSATPISSSKRSSSAVNPKPVVDPPTLYGRTAVMEQRTSANVPVAYGLSQGASLPKATPSEANDPPPMRRRSNWSASAAFNAVTSRVSYLANAASAYAGSSNGGQDGRAEE